MQNQFSVNCMRAMVVLCSKKCQCCWPEIPQGQSLTFVEKPCNLPSRFHFCKRLGASKQQCSFTKKCTTQIEDMNYGNTWPQSQNSKLIFLLAAAPPFFLETHSALKIKTITNQSAYMFLSILGRTGWDFLAEASNSSSSSSSSWVGGISKSWSKSPDTAEAGLAALAFGFFCLAVQSSTSSFVSPFFWPTKVVVASSFWTRKEVRFLHASANLFLSLLILLAWLHTTSKCSSSISGTGVLLAPPLFLDLVKMPSGQTAHHCQAIGVGFPAKKKLLASASVGAIQPKSLGAMQPKSLGAMQPKSLGAIQPKSVGTIQPKAIETF